ncbi:hypothetical protein G6F46_007846 [Rhizopus delemar]|uniref:WWE domain-containing protein n=3 Tax=Rhizopus TaxID=4842 RepID=I1BQS3_RHIO9|nr:hypothetical protein RO3G_03257 [Rhizopus delemar RA 99-880]KAG1456112.1 hypothetical protein G6F55_006686 [Rhizopus delemar]KAG1546969.1 hypothetical protein G6F51_004553 [Rhizopus arrhizus]KAG1499280.1 hypothetical protein G6F54_004511 [Rhizopus delemar]KAG1502027.1 hypothetical protein G6F52_012404 [Rhizopus delemar]|eukprot:EIE78553.1 hypothetical protein RO3G_03257 [Rhizopus delemar RA 99-880]
MKFLTLFGKKKSSKSSSNHTYSSSTSSLSSDSDSSPQTPTLNSMNDTRGIFRTLEPVWYFCTTLAPGQSINEWCRFDENSQCTLEKAYYQAKPECVLTQSSLGPCTIVFKQVSPKKDRCSMLSLPMKDHHASMPTLRSSSLPSVGRKFELNKNIRRTVSPVWWFEQDLPDGSKGMCRFDHKNQVRLEALSEGRTRLVLHDDAFDFPFTVVLDEPKERELKEEVRGFLYFETPSTAFHLAFNTANQDKSQYVQEAYIEDDLWQTSLTRRFSI